MTRLHMVGALCGALCVRACVNVQRTLAQLPKAKLHCVRKYK